MVLCGHGLYVEELNVHARGATANAYSEYSERLQHCEENSIEGSEPVPHHTPSVPLTLGDAPLIQFSRARPTRRSGADRAREWWLAGQVGGRAASWRRTC